MSTHVFNILALALLLSGVAEQADNDLDEHSELRTSPCCNL